MRAFIPCSLAVVSLAAALSSRVLAQSPEETEEIIVRGNKTLDQYRLELRRARDEMFAIFNESNQGNDTDIRCRDESPTGTRIPQSVCRSHAEVRADAAGARQYLGALFVNAGKGAGGPQVNGGIGTSVALNDAILAGRNALAAFEAEWVRVLGGNRQLYEAVLKYAEIEEDLDWARGKPRPPELQPLQITLGGTCEASTLTEFEQLNNIARVSGTVSLSNCPAGTTGSLTLVAQVTDDAGQTRRMELMESWQRADAGDHTFSADYPIGDNVTLASMRVRGLTCTCEGPEQ